MIWLVLILGFLLVTLHLPLAPSPIVIVIPDDDGIPATIEETKLWLNEAMWTHIWALLVQPQRPQWEKDWDRMWVIRYKKILQRLEFIRD